MGLFSFIEAVTPQQNLTCNQLLSWRTKTQIKRHGDGNQVCEVTCFRGIISKSSTSSCERRVIDRKHENNRHNEKRIFHYNILFCGSWQTVKVNKNKTKTAANQPSSLVLHWLWSEQPKERKKLRRNPPHKQKKHVWDKRKLGSADAVRLWSNLVPSLVLE